MRLLMIEHDRKLLGMLLKGLTDAGFDVDWASDGPTGLPRALSRTYDVILLDAALPGLTGPAVCARLREAGIRTPILMLTAEERKNDPAEGRGKGADACLAKPVTFLTLTARLRDLARRAGRPTPTGLNVGDLRIDLSARRCWRGRREVQLTVRQFAVLACLAERAGQVVTRAEILDHVWGAHYKGAPNVVDIYISALRHKIDVPFGRRSLRTVRTAGYRLCADDG
ncbi:response regulator transcription factor [Streptomyces sp. NPDC021622]|uniref:response regulator transcription factor n=1 Tax=Streptomyces sp. NPDC021622 TaxID=3155013 RepID=UPI0033FD0F78